VKGDEKKKMKSEFNDANTTSQKSEKDIKKGIKLKFHSFFVDVNDLSVENFIINLPVSRCTNQHSTSGSRDGYYWRRNPIANCKYGINNGETCISVAIKCGIICVNAIKDGFL
jgi:hypothetical protein